MLYFGDLLIRSRKFNMTTYYLHMEDAVNLYQDQEDAIIQRENKVFGFWEQSLQNITDEQRMTLTILVVLTVGLALLGNIMTIIVNLKREQRHLFKTCLLSLAISDLIYVIITSITYLSQFSSPLSSLWFLGDVMCTIAPFLQTSSILINSITILAIAFDRYMAVVRLLKGAWEPGGLFCWTCAILIWGVGAGIASPILTLYELFNVVILVPDPFDKSTYSDYYPAKMCASAKKENSFYYGTIFSCIFLPLLLAFLWLNIIIAREIWRRKRPVQQKCVSNTNTPNVSKDKGTSVDTATTNDGGPATSSKNVEYKKNAATCQTNLNMSSREKTISSRQTNIRKKRQLRMFKAIVVIMIVFFVCRLPTWVFLLIKLNGFAYGNVYWILHYSFGILSMFNCVLNPLIYTFLSETIKFTSFMSGFVRKWLNPCALCYKCKKKDSIIVNEDDNYNNIKDKSTAVVGAAGAGAAAVNDGGVYMG